MELYYRRILKTKKWRDWWITTLLNRHNRLIDLETQQPMHIDKRIFTERPRVNDYIDFLCDNDVTCTFKKIKNGYITLILEKENNRIVKSGKLSIEITKAALRDYLKESLQAGRW